MHATSESNFLLWLFRDPASGLGSLNLVQFSKVLEGLSPQGIPGSLTPIKFPATVCGSPPLPDNSPVDDEEHGFDPLIILPIVRNFYPKSRFLLWLQLINTGS